jgi:hypothetical protein
MGAMQEQNGITKVMRTQQRFPSECSDTLTECIGILHYRKMELVQSIKFSPADHANVYITQTGDFCIGSIV